jgi:hypothetical protein
MAQKISDHALNDKKLRMTRLNADRGMLLYTLAFILCVLVSVTPLTRLAGTTLLLALPTNPLLISVGTWLPIDLGFSAPARASQLTTHTVLLLALVALAFLIYALCARYVQRRPLQDNYRYILRLIWIGTIVAGLVFLLTPGMLSHDAFVYAGYGRVLTIHGANPYFVPLTNFPHDPLIPLDDWSGSSAAYGPLWLLICALCSLFGGSDPLRYVLIYRALGLAAHLLNVLLVTAILRKRECSPRTVALGTLLYAWNPLVLLESSQGGHNDTFMVTLILLGMLFCTQAERREIRRFADLRDFLLAIVAFTLAILVKFTAGPLLVLLLLWIARQTLYATEKSALKMRRLEWRRAALAVGAGTLLSTMLLLAFYAPFWIGHSIPEIVGSFTSPPSAYKAYGSIMFAITKWIGVYGLPAQGWMAQVLYVLSLHSSWSALNLLVVVITMGVGALWLWRVPTTRILALASLGVLGALLIVTPWFFPWYVIWLVGLAAICAPYDRVGRALAGAALTFSASAFCIYLYERGIPPVGTWIGFTFLSTIGPPIVVLLALSLCKFKQ